MGELIISEGRQILVQAVVGSLIAAVFLKIAAKIIVKESPTYGTAYICSFLTVIINGFLGLGAGMVSGSMEASDSAINALSLGMIPVSLLIAGGVVSHYLSVRYVKGVLIVLLQIAMTLFIIVPIVLLVMYAT